MEQMRSSGFNDLSQKMETKTKAGQNIGSAITAGGDVYIQLLKNTSVGIEEQFPEGNKTVI